VTRLAVVGLVAIGAVMGTAVPATHAAREPVRGQANGAAGGRAAAPHDKAFWTAIASNKFAVPAGSDVPALVRELSAQLGSTDPEWRDDIAYSTLASWIYRQRVVSVDLRQELMASWRGNLTRGVGESGTDAVFLRSFSALSLGILAILDNEAAYLDRAEFDALVDSALAYLRAERDVRGFDAAKGWIHSVAHTADLIKFLARSRHLRPEQQGRMLSAITDKLGQVETPLTHGEDERLARAVLSIAARPDFDEAGFKAWAPSMAPVRPAAAPTPAQLAANQNRRSFAIALFAVLSTDARDLATVASARAIVLATLKTFM
jgi:hypothetical protein